MNRSEVIIDSFAGGGGASLGIELALGRSPDIAINHDDEAVAMHRINHPSTRHFCKSVHDVDIAAEVGDRSVGLLWASPDCKEFSKAKGGVVHRKKEIRDLAWTVVKYAQKVRPRVIILENVEEFRDWGPLHRQGPDAGKRMKSRKGQTFKQWVRQLKALGYAVEWRELRACDYGAPTIRKRLFVIARRDSSPIVWPEPTHGAPDSLEVGAGILKPYRTAAECIDWSIPCPSIFERAKPLADNTLRRIARGVQKYVIQAARPFLVPVTHQGDARTYDVDEPTRTITGAQRGEIAAVAPTLIQTGYGERPGQAPRASGLGKPLGTVVAGGAKHAVVAPLLTGCGGRAGQSGPRSLEKPNATTTSKADQVLVSAHLATHTTGHSGGTPAAPLHMIATGGHHSVVATHISTYYGNNRPGGDLRGSDMTEWPKSLQVRRMPAPPEDQK